jgi:nitrate/TMAO reductase-like tetraheme cytochrome c subunit
VNKLQLPAFINLKTIGLLFAGGIAGAIFILFLIEFDHVTSSEEFCTSCHSMEIVADPYRQSRHYNPSSGVRASCGDCHVSRGVISATWDHVMGTKDLLAQLFGADYDNPVVNLVHLPDAAFSAREWFRKTGSDTCLRCHVMGAINGTRADTKKIHLEETEGKSCVDCHINIVHRKVPGKKVFKRDAWNRMVEEEFGLEPGMAEKIRQGTAKAP